MNRISRLLLVTVAPIALTFGPSLANAQDDPPPAEPPAPSAPADTPAPDAGAALVGVLDTLTFDLGAEPADLTAQLDAHRAALAEVEAAIAAGGPSAAALEPVAAELRDRITLLELVSQSLPADPTLGGSVEELTAQRDARSIALSEHQAAITTAGAIGVDPAPIQARADAIQAQIDTLNDAIASAEAAAAEPEPVVEEPVVEEPVVEEPVVEEPVVEDEPAPPPVVEEPVVEEPVVEDEPAPPPVVEEPVVEDEPAPPVEEPVVEEEPAPPVADEPVVEEPVAPANGGPDQSALLTILDTLTFDLSASVPELETQLESHQSALAQVEAAIANPSADTDVASLDAIATELRDRIAALTAAIAQAESAPPVEEPGAPAEEPDAVQVPPPEGAAEEPAVPSVGPDAPVVVDEPEQSDVEEQLAAGGDPESAENVRGLREDLLAALVEIGRGVVEDALAGPDVQIIAEEGDRLVILQNGEQVIIRSETEEMDRLLVDSNDVEVIDLGGGWTRTIIFRDDGTRIVTTTDPYGNIAERTRIDPDGTETILIQAAGGLVIGEPLPPPPPPQDFNVLLPPIVVNIAPELYIVEADQASQEEIAAALIAAPVEVVERPYTLEEIRYNERIRDKVRRVDLTSITFDTGSAAINPDQFDELIEIGQALQEILGAYPNAVFLVEGHADAVGSEYSNLLLSDRRAETVAVALSSNFGIPSENLITQGYGEAYLKIPTLAPERLNRRVALRNITELLFAAAPGVPPGADPVPAEPPRG